jgi:hypothetical protein
MLGGLLGHMVWAMQTGGAFDGMGGQGAYLLCIIIIIIIIVSRHGMKC